VPALTLALEKRRKMDNTFKLRGEIRQLLSDTLVRINALKRLDADTNLIKLEELRAANYRSALSYMDGE
jgi:hypothetical protein